MKVKVPERFTTEAEQDAFRLGFAAPNEITTFNPFAADDDADELYDAWEAGFEYQNSQIIEYVS